MCSIKVNHLITIAAERNISASVCSFGEHKFISGASSTITSIRLSRLYSVQQNTFRRFFDMVKYFFVFIAMNFFMLSCKNNFESQSKATLYPSKTFSELSDSSFVSSAYHIVYDEPYLYFSDRLNNRLLVLDKQFNVVQAIGSTGAGPGEFLQIAQTTSLQSLLFARSIDTGFLNTFTKNGRYVRSFLLYGESEIRLAIDRNYRIYISTPTKDFPITCVDTLGNMVHRFGAWIQTDSPRSRRARNLRQLFVNRNDELVAVLESEPFIEIYTLDGRLKNVIDISNHVFLQPRLKYVAEELAKDPNNRFSTYHLYTDIYYDPASDRFYFSAVGGEPGGGSEVIVCKINNNALEVIHHFELKNEKEEPLNRITSLCAFEDNKLIVFENTEATFYIYDFTDQEMTRSLNKY